MAAEDQNLDIVLNLEVADAQNKVTQLEEKIKKLTKTRDKAKKMTREQHVAADQLAAAEAKLAIQKDRLAKAVKKQTSAEEGSTAAIQRQIKALIHENSQLAKNSAQYAVNARKINELSASINVSSKASGAATSSVMELGRVISDMPYGMRGMANNLSQLVSLMFYATTAAGGFTLALKQMWKALMGPLGLVLVITAAISALDFMSTKVDKTKKALDSLTQTFGEQTSKLLVLRSALESSNVSLEKKKELIALAKDEFKELNIELDEQGMLTVAGTNALIKYTEQLVKTAKAKAILELITKEQLKLAEEEGKSVEDTISWYERLWIGFINIGGEAQKKIAADMMLDMSQDNRDEKISEYEAATKKYMDMLIADNGELALLLWNPKKSTKDPKDPKTKSSTDFSGKLLDFSDENDKIRDEEMKKTIIYEQDKLAYLHQAEMRELTQKKDAYDLKETLRYEAFVKKQQAIADDVNQTDANRKVAEGNILQAKTEFDNKMILSEENYGQAIINMKKWQNTEVAILAKEQHEELMEFQKWSDKNLAEQALYKQTFMGLIRTTDRKAEMEVIEERNAEIHERLNTEKMSYDDRLALLKEFGENKTKLLKLQSAEDAEIYAAQKFMMNSVMDSATSIFTTMKNNAKKGSEEQKKYALLEIYAGAAKGLMNGVLIAGEAATAGGPAAPFIYAGVLASQIASVYGAVSSAKQVLNGGNPSGGGAKVETPQFAPNFNVVGNSGQNQLAQSISDQTNSPTRAYVVYEDIAEAGAVSQESIESSGI